MADTLIDTDVDPQNTTTKSSISSDIFTGEGSDVAPFSINKVILTPEIMNTARELFPAAKAKAMDEGNSDFPKDAAGFLAEDLVDTMRVDFADRLKEDPNFITIKGLRDGTAGILDLISIYAEKSPKERMLTNDDIAKIFSNAEDAPFARGFFGEFAKTVPALLAGTEAAAIAAERLFSIPPKAKTPFGLSAEFLGKTGLSVLAGIPVGFAFYTAGDQIEENMLGPDPVIVPGQRASYEAMRTGGGGAASILFPFALARYGIDSGARSILNNLYKNEPGPLGVRIQAALDEMLTSSGQLATRSKTGAAVTVATEAAGAFGSSVGALLAEEGDASTGGRLLSEFIGGNIGALTVFKALPKAMTSYQAAGGVEGVSTSLGNKRVDKMIEKLNKLYDTSATPEAYEAMLDSLTSPAFRAELKEAFPDVDFSVAQTSGDPFLMALEAARSSKSDKFSAKRQLSTDKAFKATNLFIQALTSEGSERALNAAAELRKSLFDEVLQNNIRVPLNNLLRAAERLRKQPGASDANAFATEFNLQAELDDFKLLGSVNDKPLSETELSEKMFGVLENQVFNIMKNQEEALYKAAGARNYVIFEPQTGSAPEFLDVWDSVSFKNAGSQKQFELAAPEIASFIKETRRKLGLKTDVEDGTDELLSLTDLQSEVDQTTDILSKYVPVEGKTDFGDSEIASFSYQNYNKDLEFNKDSFKERNIPLGEQADLFESMAKETLSLSSRLGDGSSSTPEVAREARQAYANVLLAEARLARAQETANPFLSEVDDGNLAPITAAEISEIRSRALALARSFSGGLTPEKSDYGRRLGIFANSLRLSLVNSEKGASPAFLNASAFTKAKHDVVSRMVNGKVDATTASGANFVDPEVTLQVYMKGNPSVTLLRTRQLQALAQFVDTEVGVPDGTDPVFTTINNLTESYLRKTDIEKTIKTVFNPTTNENEISVDAAALQKWKDTNPELLELFPQLKLDTVDAITFQRSVEFTRARAKKLSKKSEVQKMLGGLLNGRSPTVAIGEAFDAKYPTEAFKRLFSLRTKASDLIRGQQGLSSKVKESTLTLGSRAQRIQKAGLPLEDINEGFRTALMQQALFRAGKESGKASFDPKTFYTFLFKPMKDSKVSVADLALKNGVFDEGQFKRLKFMSTQLVRMQAADAAGKLNNPNFVDEAGAMVDFYLGIIGSAAGSSAYTTIRSLLPGSGGSNPGQLRATSSGVRLMQQVFQNIPAMQGLDTLDEMLFDPVLVSKMFRKPASVDDANRQRTTVAEYLADIFFKKAGVEMLPYVARETFEDTDNTRDAPYVGFPGLPENAEKNRRKYIDRIQRNLPPNDQQGSLAPVQRPSPVGTPTTQASAVPLSSAPVNRERYAALFPNDSISSMMQQTPAQQPVQFAARGGIASLMR